MSTKTATITMPVDLDVDSSKYVVSGYQERVKITLTGSSAMITTLTNTRNFKVYLALQDYAPGKHTVKYQVEGLGKDIRYRIQPEKSKITIAHRKTKKFEIRYRYDTNMVKKGYTMGNVKTSVTTVQATGSASEIDRISQVVADVNVPSDTAEDVSARSVLQALDSNGNIVNVVLTPQSVNVTIPVSKVKTEKAKESSEASSQATSSSSSSEKSASSAPSSSSEESSSSSASSDESSSVDDTSSDGNPQLQQWFISEN